MFLLCCYFSFVISMLNLKITGRAAGKRRENTFKLFVIVRDWTWKCAIRGALIAIHPRAIKIQFHDYFNAYRTCLHPLLADEKREREKRINISTHTHTHIQIFQSIGGTLVSVARRHTTPPAGFTPCGVLGKIALWTLWVEREREKKETIEREREREKKDFWAFSKGIIDAVERTIVCWATHVPPPRSLVGLFRSGKRSSLVWFDCVPVAYYVGVGCFWLLPKNKSRVQPSVTRTSAETDSTVRLFS